MAIACYSIFSKTFFRGGEGILLLRAAVWHITAYWCSVRDFQMPLPRKTYLYFGVWLFVNVPDDWKWLTSPSNTMVKKKKKQRVIYYVRFWYLGHFNTFLDSDCTTLCFWDLIFPPPPQQIEPHDFILHFCKIILRDFSCAYNLNVKFGIFWQTGSRGYIGSFKEIKLDIFCSNFPPHQGKSQFF